MSAPRSDDRLAEVAHLYYVEDLSQQEIARRVHTTRSNVSRMLQAARERGIIRFQIVRALDRHRLFEQALQERIGVGEAVVLSAEHAAIDLEGVGQLAARWFTDNIEPGQRVVLSWGRTLRAMVQAVEVDEPLDIEVVQLGGDLQVAPQFSGHEIVRTLAARAGGRQSYLHAPAILESAETVAELRANPGIADQLARAASADLALVGVGAYGHGFAASLLESAYFTDDERRAMDEAGLVGDVGARFLDGDGRQHDNPLRDRVLALELDELRQVPVVVAVAAGAQKAPGVLAAVRGGWVDVVVTDQPCAAAMLHLDRGGD